MYQAVDPEDSRWVYNTLQFGGHVRTDLKYNTMTRIQPPRRPEGEPPHRYTWTTPIVLSPHDPAVVYTAAQVVLRSHDRGDTWREISPDLTTDDPEKIDGAGNIQYCTITTVAESARERGVIWAGTDDGQVQVTRDDGLSWTDVTHSLVEAGMPAGYWVTRVAPSHHDVASAYVTVTGFHRDDFGTFVFRTDDFGATWSSLAGDLATASANVMAEDRRNPSLLFLGTDHGLFATVDGGRRWVSMKGGIPVVPVRDLVVHPRENDLVVGTHGRGVFVTDITPLQQLTEDVLSQGIHLFRPEPKGRRIESGWGNYRLFGHRHITTQNEPNGVLIDIYRRESVSQPDTLRISDSSGTLVQVLEVPPEAGIQRVFWDLLDSEEEPVEPGSYAATLEADGERQTVSVTVRRPVVLPRG
jgi:hypothetical protein